MYPHVGSLWVSYFLHGVCVCVCVVGVHVQLWRAEVNRSHLKSVDDTLRLVSQGRTPKSWPAAIAQLLSTVLPDKHASVNLRVRVLMHPRRGWRLVCQRRDELGFAHTDPCALSLADSMGTTPAKEPVLDLLQQVRCVPTNGAALRVVLSPCACGYLVLPGGAKVTRLASKSALTPPSTRAHV